MNNRIEDYVKSFERDKIMMPEDLDRLIEIEKINGMIEIDGTLTAICIALENIQGTLRK